jgi:hypothetical protein
MRRELIVGLWLPLIVACSASAEQPQASLSIELQGYRSPRPERYLLGEEILVRATLENVTDEPVNIVGAPLSVDSAASPTKMYLEGDKKGPRCYAQAEGEYILSSTTVGPRERFTRILASPWILGPGEYEMWVEYAPEYGDFMEKENIPRMRVVSSRFRFEIVEPLGVDAEAFKKCASRCNQMLHSERSRQQVLEEFPISTYAGWALAGRPGSALGLQPLSLPDHPGKREAIEAENEGMRQMYISYVDQAKGYLAARPDFEGADQIRVMIAGARCYLGEFRESLMILNEVLEKEDLPDWLRREAAKLREQIAKRSAGDEAT